MSISKRNADGYRDPTAYEALTAVSRKEKADTALKAEKTGTASALKAERTEATSTPKAKKTKGRQLFVYICSPYRGDTEGNTQNALKFCRFALEQGKFPIAPHCYLPRFMNDDDPEERGLALELGLFFLRYCSEVWVFGDVVSEGMRGEINEAQRCNVPIIYFSDKKKGANQDV